MADELTLRGILEYADSEGTEIGLSPDAFNANVGTKKFVYLKINVGLSEEALPLGEVSSLGWGIFTNRDASNYIELRMASGGGNDHIKIPAGKTVGPFHFGSDVTAPYVIANTAACQLEYLIVSQ